MGLEGDDTLSGPYVYRIKAPDGARVAAHAHNQAMHQRVLQGAMVTVIGMPLDPGRARRVPAGKSITTPANAPHLEWFEGATIVEVHTRGPLTTQWLTTRSRRP
jgi:quercetin dioxygenase-like cupin family protein